MLMSEKSFSIAQLSQQKYKQMRYRSTVKMSYANKWKEKKSSVASDVGYCNEYIIHIFMSISLRNF